MYAARRPQLTDEISVSCLHRTPGSWREAKGPEPMIAAAPSVSISLVLPRVRVQVAIRRAHVVPSSIYVVPPTPCKRRTASMDGVSVGFPHVVGVVVQEVLCIATTRARRHGLPERRRSADC